MGRGPPSPTERAVVLEAFVQSVGICVEAGIYVCRRRRVGETSRPERRYRMTVSYFTRVLTDRRIGS